MQFSLMFFGSSEATAPEDKYSLVIEAAKFGDRHGFSSLWLPERHFATLGCLYPNPAVLHAALALATTRIRLHAGSVVLPLHDPIRVAEEWAVVDNLSRGRVGISFASGWHPDDFAFFPDRYANRHEELFSAIRTVQQLWKGESVRVKSGTGRMTDVRVHPTPVQPTLPVWITAARSPQTFVRAGALGANLLTHMLDQGLPEVVEKVGLYRRARAEHGYDPAAGHVTIMVHTFVGQDVGAVHELVRTPYCAYLRSNSQLLQGLAQSRGANVDVGALSSRDLDEFIAFLFDRFFSSRALFGTPETCSELVAELAGAGVDEIACLLDFGLSSDLILGNLAHLNTLRERFATCRADHEAPRPRVVEPEDPIRAIQARCTEEIPGAEFYRRVREYGVELEGSFRRIPRLWCGTDEALGRVTAETGAPPAHASDPGLLDACFQVLVGARGLNALPTTAMHIPVGVGRFQQYAPLERTVWSHAVLRRGGVTGQTIEGDVHIWSEAGTLLAEAVDVRLQAVPAVGAAGAGVPAEAARGEWLYEVQWEAVAAASDAEPWDAAGSWVILADGGGVGEAVAARLRASGGECQVVGPERWEAAAEVLAALGAAGRAVRGVIHLWSLDARTTAATTTASLRADVRRSVGSALAVLRALVGGTAGPRVWLVTRGAQAVAGPPGSVAQAPVWGLGRTCALEHPEVWGGLIDVDPAAAAATAAAQVCEVVRAGGRGDGAGGQAGFRGGQRYAMRVARARVAAPAQALPVRGDASYLITGGLWGVGLEMAKWLVARGARHLLLVGRTVLPEGEAAAGSRGATQVASLRALAATGAAVRYAAVDVTEEAALAACVRAYEAAAPAIRGVVHAASVWQDEAGASLVRPLARLEAGALEAVLAPKVRGAWGLHTVLGDRALEFFVSCSSGASVLGSAGQGNYAAAGAFLDALAQHRRGAGQAAVSVNWGPVSGTGFGATAEGERVHRYWEARGIGRLTPEEVLQALEYVLRQPVAQLAVLKLDWARLTEAHPHIAHLAWVRDLVDEELRRRGEPAPVGTAPWIEVAPALLHGESGPDPERLGPYVRGLAARVIGLSAHKLDPGRPLTQFGFDSLMAIELKNRLETDLHVSVPVTDLLDGASVSTLAAGLATRLTAAAVGASSIELRRDEWETGEI
jgi:phthiocerol/phenolphthiocerol synthesis type-I polyketide synthase D